MRRHFIAALIAQWYIITFVVIGGLVFGFPTEKLTKVQGDFARRTAIVVDFCKTNYSLHYVFSVECFIKMGGQGRNLLPGWDQFTIGYDTYV